MAGLFVDWLASGSNRQVVCEWHRLKVTTFDFWKEEIARRDAEGNSDAASTSANSTSAKASATGKHLKNEPFSDDLFTESPKIEAPREPQLDSWLPDV